MLPAPAGSYSSDWDKARKLNITLAEYNKRVTIIMNELRFLTVNVGDTVYPSNVDDYKEHGKLIVRAVCRHYDNYGDLVWNEKSPFVLQVSPLANQTSTINCTVAWVSKDTPVETTMHQGC